MQLRPYQREAVDAIYLHLRTRDDNPVAVLPTGAGKTPLISTICRDAVQTWDGRVLVLAHVRELLQQAVDKLHAIAPDLWNRVGVYSSGLKSRDTDHDIIVAGIQSVYRRAHELGPFDLVIVDEAHMIPADGEGMYRQFLADAAVVNPHVRVIGLTATPYRLKTGEICGPGNILNHVCYEVGVRELIAQGYLSPLRTKAGSARADTGGLHVRGGEFVAGEAEDLMDDDALVEGACAEIVEETKGRAATLIFAAGVRHGEHIQSVLRERHGIECGFVSGETPAGERDELLGRFKRGDLKYIANVQVLTVGFDAPHIDCVALVRPTMSPGLYYQMCLDMETEVMTPRGWARCHEIAEGDTVGAFDLETGGVEWCEVEEEIHRPLAPDERMFGVSSPHLDIRVTHLHDMVYRGKGPTCRSWRKRTAENLARLRDSYHIPIAGETDGPGIPLTDSELEFLGWALSDGHRNPHNNAVVIAQSAASPEVGAIRETLRACGFGYREYRCPRRGRQAGYPDGLQFVVPYGRPRGENRDLAGWGRLAGYLNRPIAESLADASRAQLRVLLGALHRGDGVKRRGVPWRSRTMTLCLGEHKFLADQLQMLLVRRGFRCNIASARQRTSWHTGQPETQYLLHVREQTRATVGGTSVYPNSLVPRRCRFAEVPAAADEMVWCVRTRLGTIVTRRNGKVAVVGNCGRGFRLHPGKDDCLVLDFGGNVLRHGPVDAVRVTTDDRGDGGEAPAKECPSCRALIAAGYQTCPECGHEFPPPNRGKHDPKASDEGILTGQVSRTEHEVSDTTYHIHWKRHDPGAALTMRVEYEVGIGQVFREWVCFDHEGYARQKAESWWRARSVEPVPECVEEAVELAKAGALAPTLAITIEKKAGEKFDRVVRHRLGDKPPRLDDPDAAPAHATPASETWRDIPLDEIPF